jgi:hypothetical protein
MPKEWEIVYVPYLRVGIDGWHDGVIIVDPPSHNEPWQEKIDSPMY